MPNLGVHMSIAGGLDKAIERIQSVQGTALQIFSKNQRQWKISPLTDEQKASFLQVRKAWGRYPIAIHASYLLNLATPKRDIAEKSVAGLVTELERAQMLEVPFVVLHPGAHMGSGSEVAIRAVAARLDEAFSVAEAGCVKVLLENTAGQGSSLGATFQELGDIMSLSTKKERIGMCLDTAHAFAAGYELRTDQGYDATMEVLTQCVGIENVFFMHVNDSATALGSRVDRHAHIGEGGIGLAGFSRLVNDIRFSTMPMVLETPKGDGMEEDIRNLHVLRTLCEEGGSSANNKN